LTQRQIVLDTETTGLEPTQGHRIVEVAALELSNRRRTGGHFQRYLNPEREIDPGALDKHGLTAEFLRDKPKFAEVVEELLDYVAGAELIIHNAAFDINFLNRELELVERGKLEDYCPAIVDTLSLARQLHPGKRNTLDALCERYQVDHTRRTLHGALLDAELLGDVYLAMTRGQESLVIEVVIADSAYSYLEPMGGARTLRIIRATASELESHRSQIKKIDLAAKGGALWARTAEYQASQA
jgi:DNA polymerase III subunit epsilon